MDWIVKVWREGAKRGGGRIDDQGCAKKEIIQKDMITVLNNTFPSKMMYIKSIGVWHWASYLTSILSSHCETYLDAFIYHEMLILVFGILSNGQLSK